MPRCVVCISHVDAEIGLPRVSAYMRYLFSVAMLACVLSSSCTSSSAPQTGTATQASQATFVGMVTGVLGFGAAWNLWGYGCYCGPGNAVGVIAIDERDSCCFTHDHDWMDAGDHVVGCDCNTEDYTSTI